MRHLTFRWLTAGLMTLSAASALAESGADALMNSVTAPDPKQAAGQKPGQAATPVMASMSDIKLSDPFLIQFFSLWQQEKNLSYDVNAWALRVLKGDSEGAAHLWTALQPHLNGTFATTAQGAYLYCLWKLGLSQTFFDEWTAALGTPRFLEARISGALDQTISLGFEKWLVDQAIFITPEQEAILKKVDPSRGFHFTSLQAWMSLRKKGGTDILDRLPIDHPVKMPLSRSAALDLARKGDLKGAGAILKRHLEPAIEASKDTKALSSHYLQVARLLYQAGALDGAEAFYLKIPNSSAEFLTAREELAWVWLRKGETSKLRGELKTLSSKLFKDEFAPDVYVVRSISNLKLCFYDEAEKDTREFVERNVVWAREIEAALKSENPPAVKPGDYYSALAEKALALRTAEVQKLDQLGTRSIEAALPAVGVQPHWKTAKDHMVAVNEGAKKRQVEEYRRQWNNRRKILSEAIQKMRFVKVEILSQVRQLGQTLAAAAVTPASSTTTVATVAPAVVLKSEPGEIAFPFDGVMWPDELFKLRSQAQAQCLKGTK